MSGERRYGSLSVCLIGSHFIRRFRWSYCCLAWYRSTMVWMALHYIQRDWLRGVPAYTKYSICSTDIQCTYVLYGINWSHHRLFAVSHKTDNCDVYWNAGITVSLFHPGRAGERRWWDDNEQGERERERERDEGEMRERESREKQGNVKRKGEKQEGRVAGFPKIKNNHDQPLLST